MGFIENILEKVGFEKKTNVVEFTPTYPPFLEGFKVLNTEAIIESQNLFLERMSLSIGQVDFESKFMPAIVRYAELVHLLPASEDDHHRAAGGLFKHGLEVALYSYQFAEAKMFDTHLPAEEREVTEPKWRLAAFLAGLTHDIGKPLSDYQVVSHEDPSKTWNPFQSSLYDWASDCGINRYVLKWQKGRYRKHESISSVVAERVISRDELSYLSSTDNEIVRCLFECVTNQTSYDNPLAGLVQKADHASTKQDLKINIPQNLSNSAIPIKTYLMDAIRSSVIEEKLKPLANKKEAAVFIEVDGHTYLSVKALDIIAEHLKENRVPGIVYARNEVTAALLDSELIVADFADNLKPNPIYHLKVENSDRPHINCVLMSSFIKEINIAPYLSQLNYVLVTNPDSEIENPIITKTVNQEDALPVQDVVEKAEAVVIKTERKVITVPDDSSFELEENDDCFTPEKPEKDQETEKNKTASTPEPERDTEILSLKTENEDESVQKPLDIDDIKQELRKEFKNAHEKSKLKDSEVIAILPEKINPFLKKHPKANEILHVSKTTGLMVTLEIDGESYFALNLPWSLFGEEKNRECSENEQRAKQVDCKKDENMGIDFERLEIFTKQNRIASELTARLKNEEITTEHFLEEIRSIFSGKYELKSIEKLVGEKNVG